MNTQTPPPRHMQQSEIMNELSQLITNPAKITTLQLHRAKTLYEELYYRETAQSFGISGFEARLLTTQFN